MTTKTTHKTALANHAAAVEKAGEVRALLAKTDTDLSELQNLDTRQLLADPAKASQVAKARTELAELRTLQAEMLEAADAAVIDAARVVVAEEAEEMQASVDAAKQALIDWRAKESRLLAELVEHGGRPYERTPVEDGARGQVMTRPVYDYSAPREVELEKALETAKARQEALRVAARGGEPLDVCQLENLPDCLLPGGVLVSRKTAARAEQDGRRQALAAQQAAQAAGRLAALAQRFNIDPPALLQTRAEKSAAMAWAQTVHREVHGYREMGQWGDDHITDEEVERVCELAALAGVGVAEGVFRQLKIAASRRT